MSVTLAPCDQIDRFRPYVDEVLARLARFCDNPTFADALVTDRSYFSDFMFNVDIDWGKLSEAIGVPVSHTDPSIISAARKLFDLDPANAV